MSKFLNIHSTNKIDILELITWLSLLLSVEKVIPEFSYIAAGICLGDSRTCMSRFHSTD